jgi:hypothetical protein
MKTAVLQPVGRKTARAGYKITNFGTGSPDFEIDPAIYATLAYLDIIANTGVFL